MKVFSYCGYSEFCCSWHFPNITSHLATEVVCLLLHTKFRKLETWSSELSCVTSLVLPPSCDWMKPSNMGQTISWIWRICGCNCYYHAQIRLVMTGHVQRTITHYLSGDLNGLTGESYHDALPRVTMNSGNAATSTATRTYGSICWSHQCHLCNVSWSSMAPWILERSLHAWWGHLPFTVHIWCYELMFSTAICKLVLFA